MCSSENKTDQFFFRLRLMAIALATASLASMTALSQSLPLFDDMGPSIETVQEGVPGMSQKTGPSPSLASPRATMETFLNATSAGQWERAISTLNLPSEGLPSDVIASWGRESVSALRLVMDRLAEVDVESIPEPTPLQSVYVWQVIDEMPISIERQDSGQWLFSRDTIRNLPAMWVSVMNRPALAGVVTVAETPAMRLRREVPSELRQKTLFLERWQWLAIAAAIFIGVILERILTYVLVKVLGGWLAVRLRNRKIEESLIRAAMRPLGISGMAVLWWFVLLTLGLHEQVLSVLLLAVKFMAILTLVWSAYRIVDVAASVLSSMAEETATRVDDLLIPLVRSAAKILVAVMGIVLLADNLNINITGLLAGLGLGGIAFALAAQDTVKNFFGSLTILLDHPFAVGDWIVVGEVDGVVENVGFRSTRVRTFHDSLVSMPNSNLISAHVDNYGRRNFRRWKTTVGVAYDTPAEKIEALCEGIRELVRRHPYTRKDYFHVYLNEFGACSLDILVYVFWAAPNWATELRERHRLAVDILRLTHHLGVEIAFPTQTLYLKRGVETVPESGTPGYASGVEQAKRAVRVDVSRLVDEVLEGSVPPPAVPD